MKRRTYFTVFIAVLGLIVFGCEKSSNPVGGPLSEQNGVNSLATAAGNVLVSVDANGNLRITGDNLSNCIEVRAEAAAGTFTVSGLDCLTDPTLINGGGAPVTVTGVNNDMIIEMQGGDDNIIISEGTEEFIEVSDDLVIGTGSGNDQITAANFHILDDVVISTGSGNDLVDLDGEDLQLSGGAIVFDETVIKTGDGDDIVTLAHFSGEDKTEIDAGSGEDVVNIVDKSVLKGEFDLNTGSSKDRVNIGIGDLDFVVVFKDDATVKLGGGNDDLCVNGARFADKDVVFDGGDGAKDEWVIDLTEIAGNPVLDGVTFPVNFEFEVDDCTLFTEE